MNSFIKSIINNIEFSKGFVKWYSINYSVSFNNFILLDSSMQVEVLNEYIIETYNIGVHFDIHTVVLYYVNPELNANEIINNYNITGKFTHIIKLKNNNKSVKTIDNAIKAINLAIEFIQTPF